MTRFKELKRIEDALEHKNEGELQWALAYCDMRLRIPDAKRTQKYWQQMERKVRAALQSLCR